MRVANQGSMGFFSKRFRASRRNLSIQGSSLFMADISRTISSFKPFFGLKTGSWSSDQPN